MASPAYRVSKTLDRLPKIQIRESAKALPKPPLTVRAAIFNFLIKQYGPISKIPKDKRPICLFNVFTALMPYFPWTYEPSKTEFVDILSSPIKMGLKINCFDLADAFVTMAVHLGVEKKAASEKVYVHRVSKPLQQKHNGVKGKFECFDAVEGKKLQRHKIYFSLKNTVLQKFESVIMI